VGQMHNARHNNKKAGFVKDRKRLALFFKIKLNNKNKIKIKRSIQVVHRNIGLCPHGVESLSTIVS
jgi:hypothetical protein